VTVYLVVYAAVFAMQCLAVRQGLSDMIVCYAGLWCEQQGTFMASSSTWQ
jgi:hypothetical protein